MNNPSGAMPAVREDDTTIAGVTEIFCREVDILDANVTALLDKLAPYLNEASPEPATADAEPRVRAARVFDLLAQVKRLGNIAYDLRRATLRLAL